MSTKHYCDICGDELARNYVKSGLTLEYTADDDGVTYNAKITFGSDQGNRGRVTGGNGDLCQGCAEIILRDGREPQ